jgi:hypothetical protein
VIIARVLVGVIGIALLVLGILFWSGRALPLLPLHMLLGVVLALALWFEAGLALAARVSWRLVVVVFAWGLIMPALGVLQLRLFPGSLHWLIQLLHLLVGVAAMGLGQVLARRITAALRTPELRIATEQP